jgi:hypothetical protein
LWLAGDTKGGGESHSGKTIFTVVINQEINKDHTERRMEKPANIAFAGEMGCRINHQM